MAASDRSHRKRRHCRACAGQNLHRFLSLGPTPLANSFLLSPEEFQTEATYPLDVYLCGACSLVQLLDVIDPEVLFRNYIYVTGTSDTISAHNVCYAETVASLLQLNPADLVVEVASNDGSLLRRFQELGIRTLGVEPAENIAAAARRAGIDTVNDFFNTSVARRIRGSHGLAKAVIGNNVLAHVDDTLDFLGGFKELAADDGMVIVEVPYLEELLNRLEYDTIYHEHLCYFSATALMHLCEEAGFSIVRFDRVPVHGGSLRMYASKAAGRHCPEALAVVEQERARGLHTLDRYERFAGEVERNRSKLADLLKTLHAQGKSVAGYGAPAKGNTLLNYCQIDSRLLPYTVDKNPLKVGLYTPGMHIPVLPVSTLLERQPDFVLILAWNFADEIMRQQREYQERGGRFIIPIPEPRII